MWLGTAPQGDAAIVAAPRMSTRSRKRPEIRIRANRAKDIRASKIARHAEQQDVAVSRCTTAPLGQFAGESAAILTSAGLTDACFGSGRQETDEPMADGP